MSSRRALLTSALVFMAIGAAVAGLVFLLRSNAAPSASSSLVTSTSRPQIDITPASAVAVNSVSEAFNVARGNGVFTGGPGPNTSRPESVFYVETTFGRARTVLPVSADGFTGAEGAPAVPDSSPVVVIVAYGQFPETHVVGEKRTPRVYTSVWVVYVRGETRYATNVSNARYDLNRLGAVKEVAVPLPPYPTPVQLDAATPAKTPSPLSPPGAPQE